MHMQAYTCPQEKEKYTAVIAHVPALGIAMNIVEWETVGTHKVVVVVTLNRQVGSAGVMFPSPCGHVHMGGSFVWGMLSHSIDCVPSPLPLPTQPSRPITSLSGNQEDGRCTHSPLTCRVSTEGAASTTLVSVPDEGLVPRLPPRVCGSSCWGYRVVSTASAYQLCGLMG